MGVPYYGDFPAGATVYIPFNTFTSDDPSASVTMTDFVNTDVHIHKNLGLTQRNNAAGITVDVDVDAIAGCHGVTIDTSDNTVVNFFTSGADYQVRLEGVTVDAATLNPFIGSFSIENRMVAGYLVSTTIATLASQTEFTLTAGSADNDTYNGCLAIVTDLTTAVQKCIGLVSDYVGATKTVTLAADPGIFTMAQYDQVTIVASSALANVKAVNGTLQTANDNGADINEILTDTGTTLDTLIKDIPTTAEFEARSLPSADYTVVADLGTVQSGDSFAIVNGDHGLVSIQDDVDAILADTSVLEKQVVLTGTATGGSATTIELTGGVATAKYYNGQLVIITGGTGIGQARTILSYAADTTATVTRNFAVAPDATSAFAVIGGDYPAILEAGTAQAGAAATITFDAGSSATNNIYAGNIVMITGGTGIGQTRLISAYVGNTKVATITPIWTTNPDATSVYQIMPTARVDVSKVAGTLQTANDNGADINAILTDSNELQTDLKDGGRLDLLIDAIKTATDMISAGTGCGDADAPAAGSLAESIRWIRWFAKNEWRIDEVADPDTLKIYKDDGATEGFGFTVYTAASVNYRDPA